VFGARGRDEYVAQIAPTVLDHVIVLITQDNQLQLRHIDNVLFLWMKIFVERNHNVVFKKERKNCSTV
jgi:hypothetical protein